MAAARKSTKVSANPRPRKRKPGKARARAHNPAPRKARRARRGQRVSNALAAPQRRRRRSRNPGLGMVRRSKRRKNPDATIVTLVLAAAGGSVAAVTISSVARGLLAKAIVDPRNRSMVADGVSIVAGGAAYWYGHKKNVKWLKWGGAGCLISAVAFLVKDTAGAKIEAEVAKLMTGSAPAALPGAGGYRRINETQGYRRLGVSNTEGFQQNHQQQQQQATRYYGQ